MRGRDHYLPVGISREWGGVAWGGGIITYLWAYLGGGVGWHEGEGSLPTCGHI